MFQESYNLIESKMLKAHPRILQYRQLGEITKEDGKNLIEKGNFSDKSLEYLALNQNNKEFNEYFNVIHQFTLIALDILGYNPEAESSRRAASETGRAFLLLKAMDMYIEQEPNKFRGLGNLLSINNQTQCPSTSSEHYIHNEYNLLSEENKKIVDKFLAPAMIFYANKSDREESGKDNARIEAKKKIGVNGGLLQYSIISENLNEEFPENHILFLVDAGITGAMLDDFKDFELDRKNGFGYSSMLTRGKLVNEAELSLSLASKNLSSKIQKEKFMDFVKLSFLYNLRDKLKLDKNSD